MKGKGWSTLSLLIKSVMFAFTNIVEHNWLFNNNKEKRYQENFTNVVQVLNISTSRWPSPFTNIVGENLGKKIFVCT